MRLHQQIPEHFVRGVDDPPTDESSGVIDVNAKKHLAQRAFSLLVDNPARLP